MKNAYLAICYICNEHCSFCPCSKEEKENRMITPFFEVQNTIDSFVQNNISDITISGGEPTLHPDFIEIIKYAFRKKLRVTVLTNSERFSSNEFVKELSKNVDISRLRIITTIHSEISTEHEKANSTFGSFERTINGLKNMISFGAKVIIKHCITKENYQQLLDFYKFIDEIFPECIDVQLCSIDYCGMPQNILPDKMLTFSMLKPHLEKLFDYHIEKKDSKRNLYCINMPLCSCDPYYWKYISRRRKQMYNAYKDPHSNESKISKNIVGIDETICKKCRVISICCGTYNTAFEYFGSNIVKPYL